MLVASTSGTLMRLAVLPVFTLMPANGLSVHPSASNANAETAERPWTTAQRDADTASLHVPSNVWPESTDATTASRPSARHVTPEYRVTRT